MISCLIQRHGRIEWRILYQQIWFQPHLTPTCRVEFLFVGIVNNRWLFTPSSSQGADGTIILGLAIFRWKLQFLYDLETLSVEYFSSIIFKKSKQKVETILEIDENTAVNVVLNLISRLSQIDSLLFSHPFRPDPIKLGVVYHFSFYAFMIKEFQKFWPCDFVWITMIKFLHQVRNCFSVLFGPIGMELHHFFKMAFQNWNSDSHLFLIFSLPHRILGLRLLPLFKLRKHLFYVSNITRPEIKWMHLLAILTGQMFKFLHICLLECLLLHRLQFSRVQFLLLSFFELTLSAAFIHESASWIQDEQRLSLIV